MEKWSEEVMAKKKIYAVRKGNKTGLFYSWDECEKSRCMAILEQNIRDF